MQSPTTSNLPLSETVSSFATTADPREGLHTRSRVAGPCRRGAECSPLARTGRSRRRATREPQARTSTAAPAALRSRLLQSGEDGGMTRRRQQGSLEKRHCGRIRWGGRSRPSKGRSVQWTPSPQPAPSTRVHRAQRRRRRAPKRSSQPPDRATATRAGALAAAGRARHHPSPSTTRSGARRHRASQAATTGRWASRPLPASSIRGNAATVLRQTQTSTLALL